MSGGIRHDVAGIVIPPVGMEDIEYHINEDDKMWNSAVHHLFCRNRLPYRIFH